MSKLSAFLHPVRPVNEEREVFVSDRFVGEDGEPLKFKIRALSQEENERLRKLCTRPKKVNGQQVEEFDGSEFANLVVVEATLFPDFRSKELCDGLGVVNPSKVPGLLLKSGEFARLSGAILSLSAFDDSPEGEARIETDVKN